MAIACETIAEKILGKTSNRQREKFAEIFEQYSIPPEEIEDYLSEYLSNHDLNDLAETMLAVGNQTAAPTNTEAGRRSVERWHDYYNERNEGEEEEREGDW